MKDTLRSVRNHYQTIRPSDLMMISRGSGDVGPVTNWPTGVLRNIAARFNDTDFPCRVARYARESETLLSGARNPLLCQLHICKGTNQ